MTLPVNIDSTYSDGSTADVALHQQHHDTLHGFYNGFSTTSPTDGQVWRYSTTDAAWEPATIGGAGRGTYFVTKVASDYIAYAPDGSQVASSAQAYSAIQSAIDAAAATGDGTAAYDVQLDGIVFPISSSIVMKSGVRLKGQGHTGRISDPVGGGARIMGTQLVASAALPNGVIRAPHDTTTFQTRAAGAVVQDLTIDGNSKQATHGIYSSIGGFEAREVVVWDCVNGWYVDDSTFSLAPQWIGGMIWNCTTGINVVNAVTDGQISVRRLIANTTAIKLTGGGWQITGPCHVTSAGGTGIQAHNQYGTSISDYLFDSIAAPFVFDGSNGNYNISNCIAYGKAGTAFIEVTSTNSQLTVAGCKITDATTGVFTSAIKIPASGSHVMNVQMVVANANVTHYVWNGTTEYGTPGTGTDSATRFIRIVGY